MTMIKLSDNCYVAAEEIAEIKVSEYGSHITVRMKNGIGHCHKPEYGQGIYAALDALIAKVNAAQEQT